ncbi:MAG: TOBE domain-containing protein, partial [Planctomycetales bacterium]
PASLTDQFGVHNNKQFVMGIRPESIHLSTNETVGHWRFSAFVESSRPLGAFHEATLRIAKGSLIARLPWRGFVETQQEFEVKWSNVLFFATGPYGNNVLKASKSPS